MLSLLHIENIALIQSADIRFEPGFNVLTGETGAGKSIIVDSIGAVLGERTSRELIRTGAKRARVSAVFTGTGPLDWLSENGLDQQEELLLQREILGDGRNLCRVNGQPVTVAQLRELGRKLLDIHGQHDGQQLLDPASHLDYLDRYGRCQALLEDYRDSYRRWSQLKGRIAALSMDEEQRMRRVDTLTYQIGELERAELKPGEDVELDQRRSLLRSAGKLAAAVEAAHFALSGDEDGGGACALLAEAEGELSSVSHLSGELAELAERLAALRYAADDAAQAIGELGRGLDGGPGELDQVESRLDVLYRLKKKYGSTVEEMLSYLEGCRRELEQIQTSDDTIRRLEKELEQCRAEAWTKGEALSQARKEAARSLEKRVQRELKELDMPKIRFQVDFAPLPGDLAMDERGLDQVQFFMSANVGEALKPIQKVASGGELARIMLAMKNVLAQDDGVGTLVFDEVDTGVSGRAALRVAEKMAQVARYKQVLCVTHLPQIAAMADSHFTVSKEERDGRTYTRMEQLSPTQRREALARLVGGGALTPALLDSAQELLDQAKAWRESRTE